MRAWFASEIAAVEFDEGERRLALNPAMPNRHRLYQAGQGIVVYAVASPYRERFALQWARCAGPAAFQPGARMKRRLHPLL